MNIKIVSTLISFLLLTACASHTNSPRTKMSHLTQELPTSNNLKNNHIRKKSGYSGSKIIEGSTSDFYENISDCESGNFQLKDLKIGEARVSNNDLSTISSSLQVMGYQVINLQTPNFDPNRLYSCDDLPVIVMQSFPEDLKLTFNDAIGGEGQGGGAKTVNTLGKSNGGELDRFLVYYHPKQAEKFKKLDWLITHKLDTPSSQVYIETMVLEVREEDSKEFGLQFEKGSVDSLFTLGALGIGENTLTGVVNRMIDPDTGENIYKPNIGKRMKIQALIDEGKAEVLSRPSILAISNRQAVIQIVDVIQTPVLSSTLSENGGLQISAYEFTPMLLGITLNLKPRVSADREWLTLEIDATVESEDDENNGEVLAPTAAGGTVLLATKQGSSSKKVRTFARIPDRTPIIIGGLVSKIKEKREFKIPLLGHLPLIGGLFTSMDDEVKTREIIIVLTPHILDEEKSGIRTNQAASRVTNRLSNSLLFDSKYQIKNDDLFDMSFFEKDETFMRYRKKAEKLVSENSKLKNQAPFNSFINNNVPGSMHLVNKMIFDIAVKSNMEANLTTKDIILSGAPASDNSLKSVVDDFDFNDKSKSLIIKLNDKGIVHEIVSGKAVNNIKESQIVLKNKLDIERLKAAIVAREMIALNGGYTGLRLGGMHTGKGLLTPHLAKGQRFKLGVDTLEIYTDSRSYYQSVLKSVDQAYQKLNKFPDVTQSSQMSKR